MPDAPTRWILAFDGSCGACQGIADAVRAGDGGRLELLPLQHEDVQRWRLASLGDGAAWRPVLLRVGDDAAVRAWTGIGLARRVAARLGVRRSVAVLRALGRLRAANRRGRVRRPGDPEPLRSGPLLSFAPDVAVGAATVLGILVTGRAPAAADSVQTWLRRADRSIPTSWGEWGGLPAAHRRAAFLQLSPERRSAVWTAQVDHYAATVPHPTAAQLAVFDRARTLAADPDTFRRPDHGVLQELLAAAVLALGEELAELVLAVLGPPEPPMQPLVSCTCSVSSDYCSGTTCRLGRNNCTRVGGCGTFYAYTCDGMCA